MSFITKIRIFILKFGENNGIVITTCYASSRNKLVFHTQPGGRDSPRSPQKLQVANERLFFI